MDISVIIPNFNGENLLKRNLTKIIEICRKYTKGKVEVIVTDDASKDNSIAYLSEYKEKNSTTKVPLLILENTTGINKGFSGNVNKGVLASKGEILILLNTDVVPHDDFLNHLLVHFAAPSIFAVSCMDESVENGKTVLRGRGIGKWYRGFLMHQAGDVSTSDTTLWVSCGSGAFRRKIWDTLGGLNELYNPFYWEDIDLSYRAQKAGYSVLFDKKSVVRHEHEVGSIKKNYSPSQVKTIAYRNQFFFTWLNATDTIILVSHLVFLPLFLLQALLRGDSAFILGFFQAVTCLPKVMHERKKVQKLVKKSDKEIIFQFISEI